MKANKKVKKTKARVAAPVAVPTPIPPMPLLKLDLGCGPNKREGFTGVDARLFPGVDLVHDLTTPWPWADNSVEEAHSSHLIEHLNAAQRIHFVNELWRVLKPGGVVHLIAPHWSSARAYGDLTHQWPPVCEFWILYLSTAWRAGNAPHNDGYTCNFDSLAWPAFHPEIQVKNAEAQRFAATFYKEAWQDIIIKLTAVK